MKNQNEFIMASPESCCFTFPDAFMKNINASEDQLLTKTSKIIQNKDIHRVKIPKMYYGCRWRDLVKDLLLLKPQVIALAIYTTRYTKPQEEEGESLGYSEVPKRANSVSSKKPTVMGENRPNEKRQITIEDEEAEELNEMKAQTKAADQNPVRKPVSSMSMISNQNADPSEEVRFKMSLDLGLVILNPLPSMIIQENDEVIILGIITDMDELQKKIKESKMVNKMSKMSEEKNDAQNFVDNLVTRLVGKLQEKGEQEIEEQGQMVELCLRNIKKRVNQQVPYLERILQKKASLDELSQKISKMKEIGEAGGTYKDVIALETKNKEEEERKRADQRLASREENEEEEKELDELPPYYRQEAWAEERNNDPDDTEGFNGSISEFLRGDSKNLSHPAISNEFQRGESQMRQEF